MKPAMKAGFGLGSESPGRPSSPLRPASRDGPSSGGGFGLDLEADSRDTPSTPKSGLGKSAGFGLGLEAEEAGSKSARDSSPVSRGASGKADTSKSSGFRLGDEVQKQRPTSTAGYGLSAEGGSGGAGRDSPRSSSPADRLGSPVRGHGLSTEAERGVAGRGDSPSRSAGGFGLSLETGDRAAGSAARPGSPATATGFGLSAETTSSSPAKPASFGLNTEGTSSSPGRKHGGSGGGFGLESESAGGDSRGKDTRGGGSGYGLQAESPGVKADPPQRRVESPSRYAGRAAGYGLEAERKVQATHGGGSSGGADLGYGLDSESGGRGRDDKRQQEYGMQRSREQRGLDGQLGGRNRRRLQDEDGGGAGGTEYGLRRHMGGPDLPRAAGAGPMTLQEVTQAGRPYLLDRATGQCFKDVALHCAPELVGKWVQDRVVFKPPTTELEFYSGLAEYLQRKDMALEDVFAALDGDLDGCLRAGLGSGGNRELGRLILDVMPGVAMSEMQLFCALADFDGDGFVSLEDLTAAGSDCFEAAAEFELGAQSQLTHMLRHVVHILTVEKARAQLLCSALDTERLGWLEPAGWVRFFRALCPDLPPPELRYVLGHVYCNGAEDNRKSLSQVAQTLIAADQHHQAETKAGRGPKGGSVLGQPGALGTSQLMTKQGSPRVTGKQPGANATRHSGGGAGAATGELQAARARMRARAEAVMGVLRRQGVAAAVLSQRGATTPPGGGAGPSKAGTGGEPGVPVSTVGAAPRGGGPPPNPRGAVALWFAALAGYLSTKAGSGGSAMRDLLQASDSDLDGQLDSVDLRNLIRLVMPGVTEAQTVYIRAALNPSSAQHVSYEQLLSSLARFSAGLAWETPQGVRAPLDARHILASFMQNNKVKLPTLVAMFDSDCDGLLTELDMMRLLRFAQPGLRDRQLDRCMSQVKVYVDKDKDGLVSLQDLRLALQAHQESLAAVRAQAAAGQLLPQFVMSKEAVSWGLTQSDPLHLPAMPQVEDEYALFTSNPWDPFTLASLALLNNDLTKQGPATLPAQHTARTMHSTATTAASRQGAGPVAGLPAPAASPTHTTHTFPMEAITQRVSPRHSHLDPLSYCGYQYVHDPVSNLVYLPVSLVDGRPAVLTGGDVVVLQSQCQLLVFGRLRPDKHVQRVETAAANALFAALDQHLKLSRTTLEQLVASFAPSRTDGDKRAGPIHANLPLADRLDLVGLSQLVSALVPSWAGGKGLIHYYMALFDLDGDGWVDADDLMDAFEEAGTTIDSLQTPAHVVHARAYKLLSRLASYTVGPGAARESSTLSLFSECETVPRGGLTVAEFARFVAVLSQRAADVQAETQEDLQGQPAALPLQPTAVAYAGNRLTVTGAASADDVGAVCVYVASRVMGGSDVVTWAALTTLLRAMHDKLPTHIRTDTASPRHGLGSPTGTQQLSPTTTGLYSAPFTPGDGARSYALTPRSPASPHSPTHLHSPTHTGGHNDGYGHNSEYHTTAELSGSSGRAAQPLNRESAGHAGNGVHSSSLSDSLTGYVRPQQYSEGEQYRSVQAVQQYMPPTATGAVHHHHHHHHHHKHLYPQGAQQQTAGGDGWYRAPTTQQYNYQDESDPTADLTLTVRRAPLRRDPQESCVRPQPARREVELVHHTSFVDAGHGQSVASVGQQVLLHDPVTGFLFRAPPECMAPGQQAATSPRPHTAASATPWVPGATTASVPNTTTSSSAAVRASYTRPSAGGAAAAAVGRIPPQLYPQLVGRLEQPSGRLVLAAMGDLSQAYAGLSGASQDTYGLRNLFKLHDRDGRGLDLDGLHQLLLSLPQTTLQPPSNHPASPQSPPMGPGQHQTHATQATQQQQLTQPTRQYYNAASQRVSHGISQSDLVFATLDVSGNGRVTLDELLQGCAPAVPGAGPGRTVAEQRAHRVLHTVSGLLAGSLKAFWLLYSQMDPRGVGHLSLDAACALLDQLMPGVPVSDKELVYAYLGAASVGPSRAVSPDELLVLLRVLPMRYTGPWLGQTPQGSPGRSPPSNPLTAAQTAGGSLPMAHLLASDEDGVVFKAGFVPLNMSEHPMMQASPAHQRPAAPAPAYAQSGQLAPGHDHHQWQQQQLMQQVAQNSQWATWSTAQPSHTVAPGTLAYGYGDGVLQQAYVAQQPEHAQQRLQQYQPTSIPSSPYVGRPPSRPDLPPPAPYDPRKYPPILHGFIPPPHHYLAVHRHQPMPGVHFYPPLTGLRPIPVRRRVFLKPHTQAHVQAQQSTTAQYGMPAQRPAAVSVQPVYYSPQLRDAADMTHFRYLTPRELEQGPPDWVMPTDRHAQSHLQEWQHDGRGRPPYAQPGQAAEYGLGVDLANEQRGADRGRTGSYGLNNEASSPRRPGRPEQGSFGLDSEPAGRQPHGDWGLANSAVRSTAGDDRSRGAGFGLDSEGSGSATLSRGVAAHSSVARLRSEPDYDPWQQPHDGRLGTSSRDRQSPGRDHSNKPFDDAPGVRVSHGGEHVSSSPSISAHRPTPPATGRGTSSFGLNEETSGSADSKRPYAQAPVAGQLAAPRSAYGLDADTTRNDERKPISAGFGLDADSKRSSPSARDMPVRGHGSFGLNAEDDF